MSFVRIPCSLFVFCFVISSCAAQPSGLDCYFYEGLKQRHNGAHAEAIASFGKSLSAANPYIVDAAVAELMGMYASGVELPPLTMSVIRQKAAGSWATAFAAMDQNGAINRENFLSLMLGREGPFDEAALYVLNTWQSARDAGNAAGLSDAPGNDTADGDSSHNNSSAAVSHAEAAAISGRVAVSHSRYYEALVFFRATVRDMPELFFQYPNLLIDLGRSFQYTATGREGMDLFLNWGKTFDDNVNTEGQGSPRAIPNDRDNLIRFRLLFFAARIARQRGERSIELFEQALPFAPESSPEQADACIWYILDAALKQDTDTVIRYLEQYISQWCDDAYFADILDTLARRLVSKRQWNDIANVCTLLQGRSGAETAHAGTAHYAWIISRAIEEGLFSPKEPAPAYMRIAYEAEDRTWYYRSLSAAALGEPFLTLPESNSQSTDTESTSAPLREMPVNPRPIMQFLLGFYENNAAQYAYRYVRQFEGDLSAGELRSIAGNLDAAGQYQESMRLVSRYAGKSGCPVERRDLELLYPRPFMELVEQYAEETGIEPPVLYGLIRTESAFDPNVISRAGAVGLTQLMPATAQETAARISRRGGPDYHYRAPPDNDVNNSNNNNSNGDDNPVLDLRNPSVNIHIGAAYLAYLIDRMDDPLLALLAYNGGMTRIRRWRRADNAAFGTLPPDLFLETIEYSETRNYGRRVMGAAAMYKKLYYDVSSNAISSRD